MLVYVNTFNCIGDDSFFNVARSICGWIKKVANIKISIEELQMKRDLHVERSYVRTYSSDRIDPKMYSLLYTHPDKSVSGRTWITEIGIKRLEGCTFVSILLEVSDVSTLVDGPVIATRPALVTFLKSNCTFDFDVIGTKVDYIKSQYGDFQYLMHEISRDDRRYPLVFVSEGDNGFPTKPEKLQEQLIGLAQVVATSGSMDSWEMERLLGRRFSSWNGAINIIYPINSSGYINNKLLLAERISELKNAGILINNHILSIITHSYNGYKKKEHISPVSVRGKRQKDENIIFRERVEALKGASQLEELLEDSLVEIENIKTANEELELDYLKKLEDADVLIDELTTKVIKTESEVERVRFECKYINSPSKVEGHNLDIDLLMGLISNKLTPIATLELLEMLIPENVIILKSARKSAKESSKFKHSDRLVFLLYKLCTIFLSEYLENGDNKAKAILGDAYSANESETVEKSPIYSKMREFEYENESIKMFRHVGIGKARSKAETIRVHFHIDTDKKKIVIGYCGEHLDVQST